MPKKPRPKSVVGNTEQVMLGCGKEYITIGVVDGKPFEVFTTMGKAGGCTRAQLEGLSRMISLALRYDIPVKEIVDELKDIKCPSQIVTDGNQWWSCIDAIGQVLENEK